MRKVLLVSPTAVAGGAERALCELAKCLPTLGWSPEAALLQRGPLQEWLEGAGCPVELIETGRTRQLHRTAAAIGNLVKTIRSASACVVVSNQSKGHVFGGLAASLTGVPACFWQHGIPSHSPLDRIAALVPAAVVVASSGDAVDAQTRLKPRGRVELIHPGVDLKEIARNRGLGSELRERLDLNGHPTVGIVGRLQPWKGQLLFLEAAARVARACPEARFLVVGGAILGWEGTYPADLKRFAQQTPELAGRVHFVGHQSDVYPWYDACDVVVHASNREPFGLVLVEAMALGRPLVASAAGGPTEIVEDEHSGLLVPSRDADAMARSILRILRDKDLATRLAAGARRRAHAFSSMRMAEKWGELLNNVVSPLASRREHLEAQGT
jgi:glycosyltransferase involved in cell wall biosynthesis